MILTRVHPRAPERLDMDAEGSRDRLLQWYSTPLSAWLRVNLVLGVAGNAAGSDGTSDTLTSPVDRRILGVIRELADVVLVGAQSVRVEGYRLPRNSRLAIVTSSGELSGHRLDVEQTHRVSVVCPVSAVDSVRKDLPGAEILVVETQGNRVPADAIVNALRGAGYESIVCEGGPSLASTLVAAGLVDELCLTTSPVLSDAGPSAFAAHGLGHHDLVLSQLAIDEASFVFSRWMTREPQASH